VTPRPVRLVVDGMNVLGSRPDGWWRDRDGAVRRLVAQLRAHSRQTGEPLTVVLDGRPPSGVPAGDRDGVEVLYARRGGRDAADDRIVELVRGLADPGTVCVVTSDRALQARVERLGASVRGARPFLDQLPRPPAQAGRGSAR